MWPQIMDDGSLILLRFRVFSYIIVDHSYSNWCISTKISLIVCLINVHILVCQYAKCDCRLWKDLWFNFFFFGNFSILLRKTDFKRPKFQKTEKLIRPKSPFGRKLIRIKIWPKNGCIQKSLRYVIKVWPLEYNDKLCEP